MTAVLQCQDGVIVVILLPMYGLVKATTKIIPPKLSKFSYATTQNATENDVDGYFLTITNYERSSHHAD